MIDQRREQNRTRFPTIAALVDQFRAAGIPVTVAYARENGNEVGDRARFDEWDMPGASSS